MRQGKGISDRGSHLDKDHKKELKGYKNCKLSSVTISSDHWEMKLEK